MRSRFTSIALVIVTVLLSKKNCNDNSRGIIGVSYVLLLIIGVSYELLLLS